ncbi:MAG: peptidylprolyl isomerase [Flavihumibacter sp. CACIAM 22H1]|nr:MAG: peptidylprolyl isomerase [Flavihumibacter sp. CACIAM 22H1]
MIQLTGCSPKAGKALPARFKNRDVELVTSKGTLVLRLFDETPLHRDNFLQLVRARYYDEQVFHRVIQQFMIQAGDPASKNAADTTRLGNGGPGYTIPAEIRPAYFHQKGALAAARTGDQVNPARASSGSQFYIVQGRIFTDAGLDSVEIYRLNGRKISPAQREVYKTIGGAPHLDQAYTIFGEVRAGLAVVDSIAAVNTSGKNGGDRPLQPVKIIKARLVRRN